MLYEVITRAGRRGDGSLVALEDPHRAEARPGGRDGLGQARVVQPGIGPQEALSYNFV